MDDIVTDAKISIRKIANIENSRIAKCKQRTKDLTKEEEEKVSVEKEKA